MAESAGIPVFISTFDTLKGFAQCNTILHYVTLGCLFFPCFGNALFWKIKENKGAKKKKQRVCSGFDTKPGKRRVSLEAAFS